MRPGHNKADGYSSAADGGATPEWLGRAFDALAADDRSTFDAILESRPELRDLEPGLERMYPLLRKALTADGEHGGSDEFDRAVQETRAALAAARARGPHDDTGILTELTARLAPEEAADLYRRIAPRLVLGILRELDAALALPSVQGVIDHLCGAAVQERLRAAAHAREGILDEVCAALNAWPLRERIDRQKLERIMRAAGVLSDLAIMERCVVVARGAA